MTVHAMTYRPPGGWDCSCGASGYLVPNGVVPWSQYDVEIDWRSHVAIATKEVEIEQILSESWPSGA